MKGYYTQNGYMGYVDGKGYRLFETEEAYYEWVGEQGCFAYREEALA